MADRPDPPKREPGSRYEALTGGVGTQWYLARRYFNMTPEEWDNSPWYVTACYIQGLEDQGILGDSNSKTPPEKAPGKPSQQAVVDYASGMPLPPGFTHTRRAG